MLTRRVFLELVLIGLGKALTGCTSLPERTNPTGKIISDPKIITKYEDLVEDLLSGDITKYPRECEYKSKLEAWEEFFEYCKENNLEPNILSGRRFFQNKFNMQQDWGLEYLVFLVVCTSYLNIFQSI